LVTAPPAVVGQVKVKSEKQKLYLKAKTMDVADVKYRDCGEIDLLSTIGILNIIFSEPSLALTFMK
jgi:hypothetical protein